MLEAVVASGLPPIKQIAITASAEEAVRTAQVDCVIVGSGVPVLPGQAVTITAKGEPLLTGYVRSVRPSIEADDRRLSIDVVSRTVDATECSITHPTGECFDKTLPEIGKTFDGLGIGIESEGTFPVEPRHKAIVGETLFATLERRARGRGVLIHDTGEGKLKLATKPEGRHAGQIATGYGLQAAEATLTEDGRHSPIEVRGQAREGTGPAQLRPRAVARDPGLSRNRPLIVRHEGDATSERLTTRANWLARRSAGRGALAELTVAGWRDSGGRIWQPNWLVRVEIPEIGIEGDMVIKSVTLSQSSEAGSEGTVARLSVADPRSLGGENPRGKTAAAYGASGRDDASLEVEN